MKLGESQVAERTVLFVSHNMGAVAQLCNSIIHLKHGEVVEHTNDVKSAIQNYMVGEGGRDGEVEWNNPRNAFENDVFTPTRFYIDDGNGVALEHGRVGVNEAISVCIEGVCNQLDSATQVGIALYGADGNLIFWTFTTDSEDAWVDMRLGINKLQVTIPSFLLNEGVYRIELGIALYHRQWLCEPGNNSPTLTVEVVGGFVSSKYWTSKRPGYLAPRFHWTRLGS